MSQKKAFTLIELTIVIVVISILSVFLTIRIDNSINAGKDVKRKADIELLANSLTNYSADSYSSKPVSSAPCVIGGSGADACSITINDVFKSSLPTLPIDPNSTYSYTYKNIGPICEIVAYLSTGDTYRYNCITNEGVVTPVISGACGTLATNHPSASTSWPSSNYCSQGTASPLTSTFPPNQGDSVSWRCVGDYKGTVALCAANRGLDGVCGSANNHYYAEAETPFDTYSICEHGTPNPSPAVPTAGNSVTWTCDGLYGGASPSCTAYHSKNAVCGTANTTNSYTVPSGNPALCNPGTLHSSVAFAPNDWTWTCDGLLSGNPSGTCTTHKKIDGVCGNSNNTNSYTVPSGNPALCNPGTLHSSVAFAPNDWTWTCDGFNTGGPSGTCTTHKKIDAACGTAAKTYAYNATVYSGTICAVGTASPASPVFPAQGSSTTWTCAGSNGGTSPSCTATRAAAPVDGVCGSANGSTYATAPTTNLCNPGTASAVSGTGPWTWTCAGINGGTTSGTCTAVCGVQPACHSASYVAWNSSMVTCSSGTTSNVVMIGSVTDPFNRASWTYTCTGTGCYSGTSINCAMQYGHTSCIQILSYPETNDYAAKLYSSTSYGYYVDCWYCNGCHGSWSGYQHGYDTIIDVNACEGAIERCF